jgi:hypothetical protein
MRYNIDVKSMILQFTTILLICLSFSLFAQEYTEASGQTVAFNLKAGATAAWDKAASGIIRAIPNTRASISIKHQMNGNRYLTIAGNIPAGSRCTIYSLNGQIRLTQSLSARNEILLTGRIQAGYYIARIESGSSILSTVHFLEAR